jgi:hypothetical protein
MNYDVIEDHLQNDEKNKHIIIQSKITQKEYIIFNTNIILNKEHFNDDLKNNKTSLHEYIMGQSPDKTLTIDHINWQKNDNRIENLRYATMSEQNSNRNTRNDKITPPTELTALGITKLPRYMRWDNSEKKFIVEISKKCISGTKSVKVTIINKFRDAIEKLLTVLNEHDEFIAKRYSLAEEYNDIMKTAYNHNPDVFSNITYCDLEELCGEYAYCKECLKKLPDVKSGEVLRGALHVVQKYIDNPETNVYIIEKSNQKILFDAKFKDEINKLPAISFDTGPVLIHCSSEFLKKYEIYKGKKKILVKDFIWSILMKHGPIPENHCIIPLNYQQTDLRSENLCLAEGIGKEHKAPEKIPIIPENSGITMKFWPRNVTNGFTDNVSTSPYTIHVKLPDKSKKRFTCSIGTMKARFENDVLPLLRDEYPNFDEENEIYQRQVRENVKYTAE